MITHYTDQIRDLMAQIEALKAGVDNIKQVQFPERLRRIADNWKATCEQLRTERDELKLDYTAKCNELELVHGVLDKTRTAAKLGLEFIEYHSKYWNGSGTHPQDAITALRGVLWTPKGGQDE